MNSISRSGDHESEKNNVFALDVTGKPISVFNAVSGRGKEVGGYYCMGCQRPMQAVISRTSKRMSFFRHDFDRNDLQNTGKCSFSDETYRHKLAKDILQRIKTIKVPNLYKYPPPKIDGLKFLLEEARFIKADRVENELTFFENEDGSIGYGRNIDISDKHLVIIPDVTFFQDDKPVLFIEIVATHKVDKEKATKLRRLGFDTVEIKIPKDSPENIERAFSITKDTIWIYNNVEANTDYLSISSGKTEGILPADELQRKFFDESVQCRENRIRSLIRAFNKCLQSKPYVDIEQSLRGEISRVEENTKHDKLRLDRLRADFGRKVEGRFAADVAEITERGAKFKLAEEEWRRSVDLEDKDVEGKYQTETERIKRKDRQIERVRHYLQIRSRRDQRILGEEVEAVERAISRSSQDSAELEREEKEIAREERLFTDKAEYFEQRLADFTARREKLTSLTESIQQEIRGFKSRKEKLAVIRDQSYRK